MQEPSEMMEDAFRDGVGTSDATCELCGRHVFGGDGTLGYEDGELESLRKKAEKEPDKYHEVSCDGVSLGTIDGKQIVLGCPCNLLRRYEDWIWNHRCKIVKYIKARTLARLNNAKEEADALKGL